MSGGPPSATDVSGRFDRVNPSPPAHRHAHAIGSNREQSVIDEGQLIAGHYRLLERIGSGSMGVVWRARDERLERVVAVKQLLTQTGLTDEQKEDARRRALREARIAARLHHPNAIVVFDVAEQDGDPCLVMEYMASKSMAAILAERGSMAAADVAAVGSQIASALAAAHASGIVHRDVKPANILINDAGVAKITDFGIARAAGDVTVTQTGMFAGTPAYLAPEVARGQEPTSASDVFSFGASLYDAVEGGPPFPERQNQLALLRLVAEGKVQPPRQAGVLTGMLAALATARTPRPLATVGSTQPTLPDLRPPDPEPAARTEQAPVPQPPLVLGDRPAAYRPTTASTPVDRKPVDRRLVFIAAGAAVIVLVAVGLALLLNSGGAPTHHAGGTNGTATNSATSRPTTQTGGTSLVSTPPAVGGAPTSGTINYSPAGQLVVDYFGRLADTAGRWAKLTPGAQAAFGGLNGFQQYWGQFSQLSSAHATGVTTNTDGSVNVPIDVTYTTGTGASTATHTTHEELRVVQENNMLLIDALAK